MCGLWRLFYLVGLGERRPFYGFSSRCPDLTQRGNRNGSPFTLPPPCGGEDLVRGWWRLFYLVGLGERRPFCRFSSRCPDLTRRGEPQWFPLHTSPSLRRRKVCARVVAFFCCNNESLPWWEAFSIRGVLFAGELVQGEGPQGRPPQAAARGRRPRSPPRQGRAALRAIGWGLRGRGGGQYLRRSGDVITLIRSMHFT